ncbi:MAG: DNA polymerase III subunit gamma/tau [Synergistaceae bacterium]|nr:DNA polymerase III subunit gamma/tau [Synergistaceae bacterium]
MSVSLYRKYRPQDFASIVGQKAAVDVLTNSIMKDRVGHAYLFSGSRGCGKTSAARIFAKALNCTDRQGFEPCGKCRNCLDITAGGSLDVIEIDGASNNGVENIRGLKENVTLAPFNSRYKIYIIDEVHMLSQGAFNALLKTLEEPPEHVIFIMATTEPQKVPVTIRSRCQHIPFHSITPGDIFARLEHVCRNEAIAYEPDALREISRQADGALRDALSLLEQAAGAGDVTLANVEAVFGAGSRPAFERVMSSLRENPQEAYEALREMFGAGASGVRVFEEIFSLVRDVWLASKWKDISGSLGISGPERTFIESEAKKWKPGQLHTLLNVSLKVLTEARSGVRNDILLGMFMLYLEGSPEPSPPVVPRLMEEPKPEPPEPEAVIVPPEPVKEDPGLKASLLDAAHDVNFLIWCGLHDARPYMRGNDLVLDMSHKYCYEVLRVDRTAAEIREIFGEYSGVVLRYMAAEYTCPMFTREPAHEVPQEVPDVPETVEPPIIEEMPEILGDIEPSEPPEKNEPSPFRRIIQELTHYQMKPEVVLTRKNEAKDDDTENSETETETEEETDE